MYRLVVLSFLVSGPAFGMTVTPSDVSYLDPVGMGCVDGGGYEDPFPAAKGVRAPPFCLPDPCARALTRQELAFEIVGRDVAEWEWDAYYSRYAETCRAETILPASPPRPATVEAFWEPIQSPPRISVLRSLRRGTGTDMLADNGGGGATFIPDGGNGSVGPAGRRGSGGPFQQAKIVDGEPTDADDPRSGPDPDTPKPPTDLPVVPLPFAGWLLLTALGAIAAVRRLG